MPVARETTPTPDSVSPALEEWLERRLDEKLREREAARTPALAIIATKGTLDMAYPPFILGATATALGWDVSIFFTFYGLELLKKEPRLEVSPLGNPAMPMKMPFGPRWFRDIAWNVPNAVQSVVPGFEHFATRMMEKTLADKGVARITELRQMALEGGASLLACQMTVDLFGYQKDDFIPEVADWIGAATFLPTAARADATLFV